MHKNVISHMIQQQTSTQNG
uniref:Uncharacterized protein n=1 Tax=Rhizophora mucronata TaxID=61149 RepID=A0A2P2MYC7_RHIMU